MLEVESLQLPSNFKYQEMEDIIHLKKPSTISDLLSLLPKRAKQLRLEVYNSNSLHCATPSAPRVILFASDGGYYCSFNSGNYDDYINLDTQSKSCLNTLNKFECIYRQDSGLMKTVEYTFQSEYLEMKKHKFIPKKSFPKLCNACHFENRSHNEGARIIWDQYFLWPGVYGSVDDNIVNIKSNNKISNKEKQYWDSYQKNKLNSKRYMELPPLLHNTYATNNSNDYKINQKGVTNQYKMNSRDLTKRLNFYFNDLQSINNTVRAFVTLQKNSRFNVVKMFLLSISSKICERDEKKIFAKNENSVSYIKMKWLITLFPKNLRKQVLQKFAEILGKEINDGWNHFYRSFQRQKKLLKGEDPRSGRLLSKQYGDIATVSLFRPLNPNSMIKMKLSVEISDLDLGELKIIHKGYILAKNSFKNKSPYIKSEYIQSALFKFAAELINYPTYRWSSNFDNSAVLSVAGVYGGLGGHLSKAFNYIYKNEITNNSCDDFDETSKNNFKSLKLKKQFTNKSN